MAELDECWDCGNPAESECGKCNDGAEYCGQCLDAHNALEHDEDGD